MEIVSPHQLDPDVVRTGLRAAAVGDYRAEAATELIVRHGVWLAEQETVDRLVDLVDLFGEDLSVNWSEAAAISDGTTGTPEDRAVLAIAASTAQFATPVDLFARLSQLQRANVDLVLAAISHATGAHRHVEHVGEPGPAGEWAITPTSPRVHVGALHPWPSEES